MHPTEPSYNPWEYMKFPEDDGPQPLTDVGTCGAGSLDQHIGMTDFRDFYPAIQMMQSRLVEDAGASRPAQDQFLYPALTTPPSPPTQTRSLPFNTALRLPHAAEYSTTLQSGLQSANLHFSPHDALVAQSHPPPLTADLGIFNFSQPATSCLCVALSPGLICAHQLHSAVAWDEAATEAGHRGDDGPHDIQPSNDAYWVTADPVFGPSTAPSYAGPVMVAQACLFNEDLGRPPRAPCLNIQQTTTPSSFTGNLSPPVPSYPSPQGSCLAKDNARPSGPADDSHFPLPPTPESPANLMTPNGSGSSTDSSPGILIPSLPRKRRRQRGTPYARPSPNWAGPTLGSITKPEDVITLNNAREALRKWVKANPQSVEPSIGDPAAIAIVGPHLSVGTSGKSLYSAFFSNGKPPFTCYECGHVEQRFSRAARHQRQEHFDHYPFLCQGGSGHPACGQWFASDEYATDHVKKAGPTTFVCHQCSSPRVFTNSGNLGRHRKQVHGA